MNGGLASLAAQNPAVTRFVNLLEAFDGSQPGLLRVVTYHRVVESMDDTSYSPGMTVQLPVFQEQIAFLARRYHVLSMEEVLEAARAGAKLPARSLLITFDDAYQDFADLAWPVLRHNRLPATLFVPTEFPDHPERVFWWDWLSTAFQKTAHRDELATPIGRYPLSEAGQRLNAYKTLRDYIKTLPNDGVYGAVEEICKQLGISREGTQVLSWDSLRELARQGVSLGAHTRTHPLINRISGAEMRREIHGSIEDLRQATGQSLPVFAYPGGELNDQAVQLLQEARVELGFTTRRGINDFETMDRLRIRRINIGQRTSLTVLRAQLLARSRLLYR